ncbi:Crp/Fnr family transcriptional regulator [Hydrogenoanaerobacterium sp.]|uniref:Crp/Fnr family transcriptional regulator n=1 Tax=Hydrogenoanaerobacterium sp. TaxID=2953763 RepID=UPI002897962E|nr:Crp/Fnr family transcriptional regulator [Hydrogenoanaerobacterium sp.]
MEQHGRSTLTTPNLFDKKLDDILTPISKHIHVPAKEIFCAPGQELSYIYYIHQGRSKHYMTSEDGSCKMLYNLTSGWFFGETPFFLNTPSGLYSQAETDSIFYQIPGNECDRLMKENELFRRTITHSFCHKLLMLRYEIENLSFNSCKNRLLRLFYATVNTKDATDPGWLNLKVQYTHAELGEIVGGSRVTISRQMNILYQEGFLRLVNRKVQVNSELYSRYISRHKTGL